jgi:hypothetical protein
MFNQYTYLSGMAGMEEAMQNLRTLPSLMIFSEDDGDGFLDLEKGNLDNGFHTFSIGGPAKLGDSNDRQLVLNLAMVTGLKILRRMITDSRDFGDPAYGFDRSRIDYQRIGPLLNNTYGYMFSYTLKNENFSLGSL